MFGGNIWKQCIVAMLFLFAVGYFFYGHWWVGFLLLPSMFFVHKSLKRKQENKKRGEYLKAFGDFLQAVETGLIAGYSLEHVMTFARKEMERLYGKKATIVWDLKEIEKKIVLHIPLENCLRDWAMCRDLEEIKLFFGIIQVARRRGGDINPLVRQTAENINKRIEAESDIMAMLSGKYLEYRIMCLIPLGIIAFVKWGSPDYFDLLYDNPGGIVFMTICLVIYMSAIFGGQKWIEIQGL